MRNRQVLTVSLPREMLEQVEATRKVEHRTRSELVREALRTYFALVGPFPEDEATPAEIRALQRAGREFRRGEYVTLDQLLNELEASRRKVRAKKPSTAARG